ncbi:MAG: hypothetical protein PF501_18220 [Salinisphaera sp.]|nr:hypothetical protein [Salinisphaera sp.]
MLIDIGTLRAGLGLNHSDNWQGAEVSDYTHESVRARSVYGQFVAKINAANREARVSSFFEPVKRFLFGLLRVGGGFVVLAVFLVVVSVILDQFDETRSPNTVGGNVSSHAQVTFNKPALKPPANGAVRRFLTSATFLSEENAPLEIRTSEGADYLVKLEDTGTNENILDVFIRGGSTTRIQVPLGSYILKYAVGKTWYGYNDFFGPDTGYSKADSIFRFSREGNQVRGYTVTLYSVTNGNLRTSKISPDNF